MPVWLLPFLRKYLIYGIAAVFALAWLNARENVAIAKAECNARVLQGAYDAEIAVKQALRAAKEAHEAREAQLIRLGESLSDRLEIAQKNVRTDIRETIREIPSDDCARQPVNSSLYSLYSDKTDPGS